MKLLNFFIFKFIGRYCLREEIVSESSSYCLFLNSSPRIPEGGNYSSGYSNKVINRTFTENVLSLFYHDPEKQHLEIWYKNSYLVLTLNPPLSCISYILVCFLPYC